MAKSSLTKEQKKEVSAQKRAQRMRDAKANIGSTIAQKVGLAGTSYVCGLLPETGPVKTTTVGVVLGYGGALLMGGKLGAVAEGMGDAGLSVMLARKGAEARATAAADSFIRNEFWGSAQGAPANRLPASTRDAYERGLQEGVRRGVRVGVAGGLDAVDAIEGDDDDDDADDLSALA